MTLVTERPGHHCRFVGRAALWHKRLVREIKGRRHFAFGAPLVQTLVPARVAKSKRHETRNMHATNVARKVPEAPSNGMAWSTLHGGCSRLGWKVVLCVRQCFHEAKVRRLIIKADHQEVERQMDTPGYAWECAVFSDSRVACGRQTSVCGSCSTCWCGARVHVQRSWRTRLSPTIVKRITSPLAMSALTSGEGSEVAYWTDNVSTRRDSSTTGVRCQLELHCSPFSKSAPVARET